jgi:hypothetical protein
MAEEIVIKDSATTKNPFNLDNKKVVGGKKTTTLSKVFTAEEQNALLENFLEVPSDMIHLVRSGTFARYRLKTGEFRLGGYVAMNPVASTDKITQQPITFIRFEIGKVRSPGYKTWMVKHADIAHLYVQQTLPTVLANRLIKESINKLNNNIKKLNDRLERLERKFRT